jgi:uncharacterized protein (UPF0248 family)
MRKRRKGRLEEIISKALYADNPDFYSVSYRDFDSIVEVPLSEFMKVSENFEVIPNTRIVSVRKGNTILYSKSSVIAPSSR